MLKFVVQKINVVFEKKEILVTVLQSILSYLRSWFKKKNGKSNSTLYFQIVKTLVTRSA